MSSQIIVSGNSLRLNPKEFPCCKGKGYILKDNDVISCSIKKRFFILNKLLNIYKFQWGNNFINRLFKSVSDIENSNLKQIFIDDILNKKIITSHILNEEYKFDKSSDAWALGFIGIWENDINVLVVNFKKLNLILFRKFVKTYNENYLNLIILEYVDLLWDYQKISLIEYIIDYCYKYNCHIWILFVKNENKILNYKMNNRYNKNYDDMLKKFKKISFKNNIDYLSENYKIKISEMKLSKNYKII